MDNWTKYRTKAHCAICRRKQAMWRNDKSGELRCDFCSMGLRPRVTYETLREEARAHLNHHRDVPPEADAMTLPQINLYHAECHVIQHADHDRDDFS